MAIYEQAGARNGRQEAHIAIEGGEGGWMG